jgi:hypothetical protein
MTRILLIALLALTITPTSIATAAPIPHVSSCANSFPNDGHNGPWRTNDVLHGNTVHIDCPNPSTHWDVTYRVEFLSNGNPQTIFAVHRSGNGSPNDWSASESGHPCSDVIYAFPIRTHVSNNVTGGNINKPSGGSGVINLC